MQNRAVTFCLVALLGAFAASGNGCASAAPAQPGPNAQVTLAHGDGRVGTYIASVPGFETESYWIEGPKGLILIDTQFLLSAGREALDWAERSTGKKVMLAIVLHPNPDKFNGTSQYQKRGIRVVTSEQVLELIPEVHQDRLHWFYDRFKPDYPLETPHPDSFGAHTTQLSAGGATVTAHVLGAGASGAHVVVQFENHVFVGDLVSNHNHSWLELGKTDEWLKRIGEIRALNPEFVHPGRGASGGTELLDREEAYLKKVIELVAAEHPSRPAEDSQPAIERVLNKMRSAFPGYQYENFIELGLPAEWDRQLSLRHRVRGER